MNDSCACRTPGPGPKRKATMSASSRQTFAATLTRLLAQTRRRALGHGLSVLGTWVGGVC